MCVTSTLSTQTPQKQNVRLIKDVNFSSATSSQNLPRGSICIKKLSLPCIPASALHRMSIHSPSLAAMRRRRLPASLACLFFCPSPSSIVKKRKRSEKGGQVPRRNISNPGYTMPACVCMLIQAESTGHLSKNSNPLMHISQNKTSLKKKASPLKLHKCNVKTPERIQFFWCERKKKLQN